MREILFRGKRFDNGEWVYGHYAHGYIHTAPSWSEGGSYEWWGIEVAEESVGQFTGLLDKDGTKIFESDILSYNESNYRVKFMNGSWVVVPNRKTKGIEFLYYCLQDLEITGNIHDNPELLK